MKTAIVAVAAVLALTTSAAAEISGDVVKLGVLNDKSGLYADITGAGSVEAARMAIADFGGTVNGKKIGRCHRNRRSPSAPPRLILGRRCRRRGRTCHSGRRS